MGSPKSILSTPLPVEIYIAPFFFICSDFKTRKLFIMYQCWCNFLVWNIYISTLFNKVNSDLSSNSTTMPWFVKLKRNESWKFLRNSKLIKKKRKEKKKEKKNCKCNKSSISHRIIYPETENMSLSSYSWMKGTF